MMSCVLQRNVSVRDMIKELSKISEIIENSDINDGDKERIIGYIREEEFKGPLPHFQILKT